MVVDKNGVEIKVGQTVIIRHTEELPRTSRVVEVNEDNPTKNEPGYWVEIDDGSGQEGMMSYILEVQPKA